MSTLPPLRHALAGGPADGFDGRGWRMSRPAVVVSILAHIAVLIAASRWYEPQPAPLQAVFEWLTVLEAPSEAVAQPPPEVAEPPAPVIAPAPSRAATVRSVPPPVVAPPQPAALPDVLPAPPVGPSRFDLDAARRAAAVAVVEQRARDSTLRAPSIDDVPPPRTSTPKRPSIFEPQPHSGGGVLAPSKARTAVGQRLSLWCNKVSGGGFGFFGMPVCMSGRIEPPSGILADSIPEYMKLKPECEETQPLAATLGENGPFPTMKCRLVPKDQE